jgi:hypothetical protein
VDRFLDSHLTELTRYEEWVINRELNKMRKVLRRARTLDDVMRIVINEPTLKEQAEQEWTQSQLGRSTGTFSGTLGQYAAAHQAQVAHIHAHQQMMNQAQSVYPMGNFIDPRTVLMNGNSQ